MTDLIPRAEHDRMVREAVEAERTLLRRYMAFVDEQEGTTFVHWLKFSERHVFSAEESEALNALDDEIYGRAAIRAGEKP